MKVRVQITIDVDPDAYNREYGTEDVADTIRGDLRATATDAVDIALKHLQPHAIRSVRQS